MTTLIRTSVLKYLHPATDTQSYAQCTQYVCVCVKEMEGGKGETCAHTCPPTAHPPCDLYGQCDV